MKIKTSCDKCIFNNDQIICNGDRKRFVENEESFTNGFCNIKRISDLSLKEVLFEESKMSIILLAEDIPPCKIEDFLNVFYIYCDDIIILTTLDNPKYIKRIADHLKAKTEDKKSKGKVFTWTLEAIRKTDIQYEKLSFVDYAIKNVKTNWFAVFSPNDIMLYKKFKRAKDLIADKFNPNKILIYFDLENDFNIITNKYAFVQTGGNANMPFFKKIKSFENWEKHTVQI